MDIARGKGAFLRSSLSEDVSPERVRDTWHNVVDMTQAVPLTNSQRRDELSNVLNQLQSGGNSSLSTSGPKHYYKFGSKDLILYALGGEISLSFSIFPFISKTRLKFLSYKVGATVKDSVNLKFLYENHPEFSPLPTFFVLPAFMYSVATRLTSKAIKHKLSQVLHGEQYLEVFDELPTEGELISTGSIIDVCDKRSGALVNSNSKYLLHFHEHNFRTI